MGGAVLSAAMIAWAQSQIEGIPAQNYNEIAEGLRWQWNGAALSLASRPGALLRTEAMVGHPVAGAPDAPFFATSTDHGAAFVVTDGERLYSGLPVSPDGADAPLLVFADRLPPQATDLRIVQADADILQRAGTRANRPEPPALLCFTPGTVIETDAGHVRVENLSRGDRVMTRDNGAQEMQWIGSRRMTGARLFALPSERPIRIRRGAMGEAGPVQDLLVSPDHRILRRSQAARQLWGEDEVLTRAADLLGTAGVSVDACLRGTQYVTVMLAHHEIIRANGMEVESFHPGFAGAGGMAEAARNSLLAVRPDLTQDAHRFGPSVRRQLTAAEAEIERLGSQSRRRRA